MGHSQIDHKIVFAGPVGSGKTTAITAISDIAPITTDEIASDMTTRRKPTTTVALDYGLIRLSPQHKLHLYGTPGQERFDFMWDIATRGAIGLILLLDNTRPTPFADMRFFAGSFRPFIDATRMVVGVTQMDQQDRPGLDAYAGWLDELGLAAPVFRTDARRRDDVSTLVHALLQAHDRGI